MTSYRTYMRRCLELARRAEGETDPNPMVGAVVVRDDRIVAEGWHRGRAGGRLPGGRGDPDGREPVHGPDRGSAEG